MKLRDILASPFILRSESVESGEGVWVRSVSYPELGCLAEDQSLSTAMQELEEQKLRVLLAAVEEGRVLPPLRHAVPDPTIEHSLIEMGFQSWVSKLDLDVPGATTID